ncbi:MAG TPA: hypothetical protein VGS61_04435, partial [Acidimicrobiales bacterium]|nr:hypothetical protein [Acidimicrobiales bacterium]
MANRERLRWYDLSGSATAFAIGAGLADAEWFRSEVPRARMRELMARSDGPAIRDTVIWID